MLDRQGQIKLEEVVSSLFRASNILKVYFCLVLSIDLVKGMTPLYSMVNKK